VRTQFTFTDSPPSPLDGYPRFIAAVRARLERGRITYGDASFDRPEAELLGEIQQECLDLAGWGFVLWTRLQLFPSSRRHRNSRLTQQAGRGRPRDLCMKYDQSPMKRPLAR
jgi:hypothetical protein